MKSTLIHRQYQLEQALQLGMETAARLNIGLEIATVNETGDLITLLCHAHSQRQQIAFRGAGTGKSDHAKIRAVMEALEDCLLHQSLSELTHPAIHFFTAENIPLDSITTHHELLPTFLQNVEYRTAKFPWLKLRSQNNESLYYPVGLFFPHAAHNQKYNQTISHEQICQFANTTGLALGLSIEEATLHGINDWIERDAYGLFLLHTLLKKKHPIRLIDKKTLPEAIYREIEIIEKTHGDELFVIDITSNLDIPAFLVSFSKQAVPVQPSGLGASLDKQTALLHALHEALQARDRYNVNTIKSRRETLSQFHEQPLLLTAFKCDLQAHINQQSVKLIAWDQVITLKIPASLDAQIQLINQHLAKHYLTFYSQTLWIEKNGLTLTYVLIPGLETFGTIREGIYSPIKQRGREYLHEQSA